MLAPQTLITATLVTIAEPNDIADSFIECAVCAQCFDDGDPAYTVGAFPPAYLHILCA